jgi:hypothetical protein
MLTLITPHGTRAMVTEARARVELRLQQAEEYADLLELIYAASDACAKWCRLPVRPGFGRSVWRQTERLDTDMECIVLGASFLPAVSSITVDGEALTADEYEIDDGLLYRLDVDDDRTTWRGKVVINYSAGFDLVQGSSGLYDLPHDLERACTITLAAMWGMRGRDPTERTHDDGLVSSAFRPEAVPLEAQQLLQPYRVMRMAY